MFTTLQVIPAASTRGTVGKVLQCQMNAVEWDTMDLHENGVLLKGLVTEVFSISAMPFALPLNPADRDSTEICPFPHPVPPLPHPPLPPSPSALRSLNHGQQHRSQERINLPVLCLRQ